MQPDPVVFHNGRVVLFKWSYLPECPVQEVTPNVAELLGYTVEDFVKKGVKYGELIHPEDSARVYQTLQDCIRLNGSTTGRQDYRLFTKDGSIVWVEDKTNILRDNDGNVIALEGYIIDVTNRVQGELALKLHDERLQAITNLMSDWAWEVDQSGIYTYCSDRVEQFLGYRADEIIGKSPFELMPPEEAERVGQIFLDIVKRKGPIHNLENWNLSKDNRRVCLLTNGIPLLDSQGELVGYRGVDTDITQRKNDEVRLKRAYEAATDALRVKTEFLANISHELRTPLNGIVGALELVKTTSLDDEQHKLIDIANSSSSMLQELIDNLLSFSNIELGTFKLNQGRIKLKNLVQTLSHQYSVASNVVVPIEFDIDENLPAEIQTDQLWLKQILSNIINNAIKFTEKGRIKIIIKKDGDYIQFVIEDTGIGIPNEEQDNIFRPFYQIDATHSRKHGGAGIGLSLCRDMIERLGGNIDLTSQVAVGTTVCICIPA